MNIIICDIVHHVIVQYWPILLRVGVNYIQNIMYMFNMLVMKNNKMAEALNS